MKFFAIASVIFILTIFFSVSAFVGLASVFFTATAAEEYSPLDFAPDCSKFEIQVGIDQENGRYATYHYEFAD